MSSLNKSSTTAKPRERNVGQTNPQSESEQTFSIQPHPATTNDPQDLQRKREPGGGLQTSDPLAAYRTPGPMIPSSEMQAKLEKPLSKEELQARAAELNK
ncbi:hypothetical protein H0H92_009482 [Tricholoma furcatifolium]|nr:hypothetical protein H0H92_009482 [Tricholoma furcatifolium]